MKHILTIEPAIDVELRHKIQDLLRKEGYDVSGGGTTLVEPTASDISFSGKKDPGGR